MLIILFDSVPGTTTFDCTSAFQTRPSQVLARLQDGRFLRHIEGTDAIGGAGRSLAAANHDGSFDGIRFVPSARYPMALAHAPLFLRRKSGGFGLLLSIWPVSAIPPSSVRAASMLEHASTFGRYPVRCPPATAARLIDDVPVAPGSAATHANVRHSDIRGTSPVGPRRRRVCHPYGTWRRPMRGRRPGPRCRSSRRDDRAA